MRYLMGCVALFLLLVMGGCAKNWNSRDTARTLGAVSRGWLELRNPQLRQGRNKTATTVWCFKASYNYNAQMLCHYTHWDCLQDRRNYYYPTLCVEKIIVED